MRPMILVAEPEPLQALSVRKLVLETAKFNVLTAHSTAEALESIAMFPKVAAAVLVAEHNIACEQLAPTIKKVLPDVLVVVLSARVGFTCPGADHLLSSHNPEGLVTLMRELLGDPRTIDPGPDN